MKVPKVQVIFMLTCIIFFILKTKGTYCNNTQKVIQVGDERFLEKNLANER